MSIDLTFIGQIVVFLSMVFLLKKFLYAPMNDLMAARSKRIEDGLAAADAGAEAKAKAEKDIKVQIKEARTQAQQIVSAAEHRAAEIQEESVNKARDEHKQIVDSAHEEAEAEIGRARQALHDEVAGLSILAAEKVLDAEIDAKKHSKIIEGVIAQGIGNA